MFMKIRRALLSVFDKTNLKELALFLHEKEIEIISTGGTAEFLVKHQIPVTEINSITGFPEILDGRVKTLHPKIHGGILADRQNPVHLKTLNIHQIDAIDLVVVNLYPFEKILKSAECDEKVLLENIDIGGVTLLRAAAKNYQNVVSLTHPDDYLLFIEHFKNQPEIANKFRKHLAVKVFQTTSAYDQTIMQGLSKYFNDDSVVNETHKLANFTLTNELRYGENPHQQAQIFSNQDDEIALASSKPLQGKILSYNNLLDADAALFALRCLIDIQPPGINGAVVIKHNTLCGAALNENANIALKNAIASDELSAFGGIIALSNSVTDTQADILVNLFLEVIIAPSFSPEAKVIFSNKPNLRLLEINNLVTGKLPKKSLRSINGGLLEQDHDQPFVQIKECKVVTKRSPTETEWRDLDFAFRTCIPSKSNAITLAKNLQLLSVGAGQTSRIDSVNLAIQKALERKKIILGSSLGSDAFFPFTDGIIKAAKSGITAIIQPGGSIKDQMIIKAVNIDNFCMVFTSKRHFRH